MERSQIESALKDLNALVIEGKVLEAFDKYYDEDVSMQENNQPPTLTKDANRLREQEFLANVLEFRGAEVKGLGIGDDISYVTWSYDYTHREWGVRNYTQVSVQHWKNGKIISEQFIYPN